MVRRGWDHGTDGPTEVAGAIVNGTTGQRARRVGLDPAAVLRGHDSYRFFRRVGGHVITGPPELTWVMCISMAILCGTVEKGRQPGARLSSNF